MIGCGSGRLSKSEKNIGAGGLRMDNLFEAADSGDIWAHPRISNNHKSVSLQFNKAGMP